MSIEDAAVQRFTLEDAFKNCAEPWMVRRVYGKLNEKLKGTVRAEGFQGGFKFVTSA